MRPSPRVLTVFSCCAIVLVMIVVVVLCAGCSVGAGSAAAAGPPAAGAAPPVESVALSDSQLQAIKLETTATHAFRQERTAVGSIDFDENLSVQVFSPYAGKIIQTFAELGDEVPRGKILYSIDSPDLIQAESNLIAAAGAAQLTTAALARAKDLYQTEGMAQKDYEQAVSDQMAAEGALKAARNAMRVFGKNEHEIDAIVAQRRIDPALQVLSPISGRVTARFAQPGLLVQPGGTPAPYSVANLSTMWMLASVPESDVAALRLGQPVRVRVMALGERQFGGKIQTIGASVDPTTHTAIVRATVADPGHELRSGMIANFVIQTAAPLESVAIPVNGVVREGDGTLSAWVTTDRHRFVRRVVRIGLQQDGIDQILDGLKAGELVVTDGAILISNMLYGGGGD